MRPACYLYLKDNVVFFNSIVIGPESKNINTIFTSLSLSLPFSPGHEEEWPHSL